MSTLLQRMIKSDPKGRDPKYKHIIEKARIEATEIVEKDGGGGFGTGRVIENEQQRILKEKYNIDWKTRAELNPYVCFD